MALSSTCLFFFDWSLLVSADVAFMWWRTSSSSRKFSYCIHLMMIFSACCNSERVNFGTGFSSLSFDFATGIPGSLTSLAKSLDFSCRHRAMTFVALYQLDSPCSLLLSKWPGNDRQSWQLSSAQMLSSLLDLPLERATLFHVQDYKLHFPTEIWDHSTNANFLGVAFLWVLLTLRPLDYCETQHSTRS